jgi:hypothetical protein
VRSASGPPRSEAVRREKGLRRISDKKLTVATIHKEMSTRWGILPAPLTSFLSNRMVMCLLAGASRFQRFWRTNYLHPRSDRSEIFASSSPCQVSYSVGALLL